MNGTVGRVYHFEQRERPASLARRREARKVAEREAHGLVVGIIDARGRVPRVIQRFFPTWWKDLRRKQNTIYGGLLRFIDVSILAGVPRRLLKQIPRWLDTYIDDCYEDRARVDPARVDDRWAA